MIVLTKYENSHLSYVISLVINLHIGITKLMTRPKKPEISGFFATQIPKKFLKKRGMTLGYFRPLAGFELSKVRIQPPPKVEIQANLDFVGKNSTQSFGLGFSGFHEM